MSAVTGRSELRFAVRVRTGAPAVRVGGRYGPDALLVAVGARPVDGAANRAVTAAIADSFGVPRRDVAVVVGQVSRTKVVAVAGDPAALARRLAELLGG
jgi:uncharacterized protein YggU (UPF0235/DUF167 family)